MPSRPPIVINDISLPPLLFNGQPVITLAMMDHVHGRPPGTARRNFRAHKPRLVENEDYLHLTRARLPAQDSARDELRSLTIPPTGIILLTESGYRLLVKSFTDELAWQVQRALVNSYFKALESAPLQDTLEAPLLPAEQQTLAELVRHRAESYGALQGKVLAELWSRLHNQFRVARYQQLPRRQLAEAIRYVLTAEIRTAPPPDSPRAETPPRARSHANTLPAAPSLKANLPALLAELEQQEQALQLYDRLQRKLRRLRCRAWRQTAIATVAHGWTGLTVWVGRWISRRRPHGKGS